MASPPFMPLYVGDYLSDTRHLTTLEHGAYCLLLMVMWRNGGSLPDDDAKLAKFAGLTTAQWARIKDNILAFFDRDCGQLVQKRLVAEMEKHARVVRQNSAAGKKSAENRRAVRQVRHSGDEQPTPNALISLETGSTSVQRASNQPEPEPEGNTLSLARVTEAAGEALADPARTPGVMKLGELISLTRGGQPCSTDDVLEGVSAAAAWHLNKGGPRSMTNYTLAAKMAVEARDRRLAGAPPPQERNGHVPAANHKREALERGLALAPAVRSFRGTLG